MDNAAIASSSTAVTPLPKIDKYQSKYVSYLDPKFPLEDRLEAALRETGISTEDRVAIRSFLAPIKVKHLPTYEHSIRVGLVTRKIASYLQLDVRALLMAGLLHDIGKASLPLSTLDKVQGWTKEDQKLMQRHVMDGYRMLKGRFDFTAEVILWHHKFQRGGYPVKIPALLHPYSAGTRALIQSYGRIVAIADTYDALHRVNDKHGELKEPTGIEIKDLMLQYNPDKKELIDQLYKANILTTFLVNKPHKETMDLDTNDPIHEASFVGTDTLRTSRNTRRHVMMAAALEPVSDKSGCTTRYRDISRHLLLEYFISAAINIGDAFEGLAKAVTKPEVQPPEIYQFGYQAQLESKRNRRGGRVNQGLIEMLVPIVTAQHLIDPEYKKGIGEILDYSKVVLQNAGQKDIEHLRRLKALAYKLSHYDRAVGDYRDAKNVYQYYEKELALSDRKTSSAHNGEFVNSFPTVRRIAESIINSPYPHFRQRIEEAFHKERAIHDPDVSSGVLADCIAVGIYLVLSQDPKGRLVG